MLSIGLLALACGASSCGLEATAPTDLDRPPDQGPSAGAANDPSSEASSASRDADGSAPRTESDPSIVIGLPPEAVPTDGEAAPVEGIVAGTDSSTPVNVGQPGEALRAKLVEFATLYLSFDYRVDHDERIERFRPLVTPGLLEKLATPIPSALRAQFDTEERITEATMLELSPVDSGVYALSIELSTTTTATVAGSTDDGDRVHRLVIVVDNDQLVSDVR